MGMCLMILVCVKHGNEPDIGYQSRGRKNAGEESINLRRLLYLANFELQYLEF